MYIPALDGLRFTAFLLVFLHHLPPCPWPVVARVQGVGWVGVHIFFFLSAYLLTRILSEEYRQSGSVSVVKFLVRRSLRIWPLYFLFVGLSVVCVALQRDLSGEDWWHVLGLLTFTANIVMGVLGYSAVGHTSHLWTIGLEEQFYLLLPCLLVLWLRRGNGGVIRGVFALWLVFMLFRVASVWRGAAHPWVWTSLASGDALLLGTVCGLGTFQAKLKNVSWLPCMVGCVACGLGVVAMPDISAVGWHQVVIYSVVALGSALLAQVSVRPGVLSDVLSLGVLRYFGKVSYGLYVFHMLAIALVGRYVDMSEETLAYWGLFCVLALGVTIAASILSFELVERPFLKMKSRYETVRTRPL